MRLKDISRRYSTRVETCHAIREISWLKLSGARSLAEKIQIMRTSHVGSFFSRITCITSALLREKGTHWRHPITLERVTLTRTKSDPHRKRYLSISCSRSQPSVIKTWQRTSRQIRRRTSVNLAAKSPRRVANGGIKVHVSEAIYLSDYRYGIAS